jgi:hypothetical protein
MDQIKEFFLDKSLLFVVDYANSALKGKVFLTYISNLDLPAEVDLSGATKEQKMELLKDYMEVRNINECRGLATIVTLILLHNRGVDISEFQSPLTAEEMKEFGDNNTALLKKWYAFLDSMIIFTMMSVQLVEQDEQGNLLGIPAFEEAFPGVFDKYEVVDDPLYIGSNVVNVFQVPLFLERYFSVPTNQPKYFKQQFTEYMFKGKRLFHYFANERNTFFKFLVALVTKKVTVEDMVKAFQPK